MCVFESRIKLILLVVTVTSLGLRCWLNSVRQKSKPACQPRVTQTHLLSHILFILWVEIPYHYIFVIDDFAAEVKQWRADMGAVITEKKTCPQFDSRLWSRFSMGNFISVMLLVCILYLNYFQLFRNMNQLMKSFYQNMSRPRENDHEAGLRIEKLIQKKDKRAKRVTFLLPEPRPFSKAFFCKKLHEAGLLIFPGKREVVLAISCLGLSVFLLSKSVQHAFTMHLVRIGEFTLNSDHIIAATLLFTGFELAHTVGFGFSTPTETSNIRLAVSRFIEFYGIFLMIVSAIVWLQANDTLKLYIYKLFTHCGSIRKSRSFFDVHVPNENIVSALLGESMMKYTNSVLKEDFDQKQTTEAINSAISLFIWVLGDCVTVLLFATLVVIPGVLASLW